MIIIQKPRKKLENRVPWSTVDALVKKFQLRVMLEMPAVSRVEVLGSYRRGKSTLGDIDAIAVENGRESGTAKILNFEFAGIPGQLHMISPDDVGSFRVFVTGSGNMNLLLRATAKRRGLRLNRYGLWDGEKRIANDERKIFEILEMKQYIDPASREIELDWKRN